MRTPSMFRSLELQMLYSKKPAIAPLIRKKPKRLAKNVCPCGTHLSPANKIGLCQSCNGKRTMKMINLRKGKARNSGVE